MIGRTLAHYRITAAIGAGGMGEVYRAADTKLGRDIALKVLPAEREARSWLERFEREARAVAALNHPHIVTIHSVEQADGVDFLTMELLDGQPLHELIPVEGLPSRSLRPWPTLSPRFTADPEQVEGRALGPASDVFSLGVVLYKMATGRRSFGRRDELVRESLDWLDRWFGKPLSPAPPNPPAGNSAPQVL